MVIPVDAQLEVLRYHYQNSADFAGPDPIAEAVEYVSVKHEWRPATDPRVLRVEPNYRKNTYAITLTLRNNPDIYIINVDMHGRTGWGLDK